MVTTAMVMFSCVERTPCARPWHRTDRDVLRSCSELMRPAGAGRPDAHVRPHPSDASRRAAGTWGPTPTGGRCSGEHRRGRWSVDVRISVRGPIRSRLVEARAPGQSARVRPQRHRTTTSSTGAPSGDLPRSPGRWDGVVTPTPSRSAATALAPLVLALLLLVACPLSGSAADEVPVGTWPLRPQPAVVHLFAPPPTPYAAGHRGVDLAASAGQPVRAALPGTVTFAGSIAGRGVVVVDHGTTRTTYEPVDASVRTGTGVRAGQPVGRVRAGPASHCFPATCLHWGWIAGETYLDPLLLVGAGPVRLLPLEPPAVRVGAWPWPRAVTAA